MLKISLRKEVMKMILKKMNIYDLAGNEEEWTLENVTSDTSYPCARRGGSFGSDGDSYPASFRHKGNTDYSYNYIAFRTTLY